MRVFALHVPVIHLWPFHKHFPYISLFLEEHVKKFKLLALMHRSIPAVTIPPLRADPQGFVYFFPWDYKFPALGPPEITNSLPPGNGKATQIINISMFLTFKQSLQLSNTLLFQPIAHKSSGFTGEFFHCYWSGDRMGLAIGQVVPAPYPRGNTLLYKIPAPGTQGLTNPGVMPGGDGNSWNWSMHYTLYTDSS